jgi:hypothetical protein
MWLINNLKYLVADKFTNVMVPHISMLGPSMRFLTLRKGLGTLVVFENNNRIFAIKMNIEILHLPVNGHDLSCHIIQCNILRLT